MTNQQQQQVEKAFSSISKR